MRFAIPFGAGTERHEEFESLYLDRAKIEEIMLSEKTDDLLDQFGGASSTDDKNSRLTTMHTNQYELRQRTSLASPPSAATR